MTSGNGNEDPKQLILKAKAGDSQAFGILYDIYFTPIYRYVYHRVRSKEESEDIVQIVFVKAFKAIDRFRETSSDPLAYFFTIARNTVIDGWKKKKEMLFEEPESMMQNIPDSSDGLNLELIKKDEIRTVMECIEGLTDEQKEIITLKFVNDLSNKEIAEITGKKEDAIRQLQSRAIKKLKEKLEQNHE
ncbi:MAG: RNA polymerase sigma factor [Parcubacteria group bacterium]